MTEDEEKVWLETVSKVKKINTNMVESHKKPAKRQTKEVSIPFVSRKGLPMI